MTKPFRFSEYLQVKNKMVDLQEEKPFYYYLFSASGFEEKLREVEHVTLVDIDEVVNGI